MRTMKKIGIGTMAVIGTAIAVNAGARIVDKLRRKWFMNGFHMGGIVGGLTAAEGFTKEYTALADKYSKLCEEYDDLENNYNEMLGYYGEDDE